MTTDKPKMSPITVLKRYVKDLERVLEAYKGEVEHLRFEYRNIQELLQNDRTRIMHLEQTIQEMLDRGL